jgi:hypothetical protein
MANGNDPTYRRIPYRVRVRLRRLGALCAHGCASVAHAAHAEIGRIHRKYRLSRPARVRAWLGGAAKAGVRKVTPSRLHGPLRVRAAQAKAPTQARTADIPAGQWRKFTPLTDHTLTRAELRQRARDEKAARRQGRPQPAARQNGDGMDVLRGQWQGYHAATYGGQEGRSQRVPGQPPRRQPDAMQQAQDAMRRAHQQAPTTGQGDLERGAAGWRNHGAPAGRDQDNAVAAAQRTAVPDLPGHPESVRKAAEDHEKGRWAGLRSRLAPEHTTRSRTRSA